MAQARAQVRAQTTQVDRNLENYQEKINEICNLQNNDEEKSRKLYDLAENIAQKIEELDARHRYLFEPKDKKLLSGHKSLNALTEGYLREKKKFEKFFDGKLKQFTQNFVNDARAHYKDYELEQSICKAILAEKEIRQRSRENMSIWDQVKKPMLLINGSIQDQDRIRIRDEFMKAAMPILNGFKKEILDNSKELFIIQNKFKCDFENATVELNSRLDELRPYVEEVKQLAVLLDEIHKVRTEIHHQRPKEKGGIDTTKPPIKVAPDESVIIHTLSTEPAQKPEILSQQEIEQKLANAAMKLMFRSPPKLKSGTPSYGGLPQLTVRVNGRTNRFTDPFSVIVAGLGKTPEEVFEQQSLGLKVPENLVTDLKDLEGSKGKAKKALNAKINRSIQDLFNQCCAENDPQKVHVSDAQLAMGHIKADMKNHYNSLAKKFGIIDPSTLGAEQKACLTAAALISVIKEAANLHREIASGAQVRLMEVG